MDSKSGLHVIRRFVTLGVFAWTARWAVLLAASALERRKRQ